MMEQDGTRLHKIKQGAATEWNRIKTDKPGQNSMEQDGIELSRMEQDEM